MTRARIHLGAFAACALATLAATWPLAVSLKGPLSLGDGALNLWILMWDIHALTTSGTPLFQANIFHPVEVSLAFSENLLGTMPIALPVWLLTGDAAVTYNLVLLSGYLLSAFGACLLAHRLTARLVPSLAAGLIYGFCSYKMSHFWWLQLTQAQWLPFCLLFFHRYTGERRLRDAVLCSLFFVWQVACCMYYGLFLGLALAAACVYEVAHAPRRWLDRRTLGHAAVCAALAAILLAPLISPYLEARRTFELQRTPAQVDAGGADLLDYLRPHPANRLWGWLAGYHPQSPKFWEKALFVGLAPLLGLACLALAPRQPPPSAELPARRQAFFYLLLALLMIVLSAGLEIRLGGTYLAPGPYRLLAEVPGFHGMRVPARMAAVTMLALAVAAACGVAAYRGRAGRILAAAFLCLAIADSWSAPIDVAVNRRFDPRAPVPEVYAWLARQPGKPVIVELPMTDLWAESQYMYYSTFHFKPMVNGYSGFHPGIYLSARRAFRRFPGGAAYPRALELGVRYVIHHGGKAIAEDDPRWRLVAAFGNDRVYEPRSL